MQCLHGKEAASSTTNKGHFWFCAQNPKCQFICSEDEAVLYDRAIQAFLAANCVLPKCCVLEDPKDPQGCNFAKIRVVTDPQKENTSSGEMKLLFENRYVDTENGANYGE